MAHGDSEEPWARRRRLDQYLILVAILVVIAAAGLALVLVLDDGSTDNSTTDTSGPTRPAPTTPEEFAKAAYDAWKSGDRTAAAAYASPEAVDQLFAVPYDPTRTDKGATDPYGLSGCEGAAGSEYCTWTDASGARVVMAVRTTTGGLPVLVVRVQRSEGTGAT